MLEQVRKAGAALGLGAEPDVVVHRDADDRGAGIGGDQDPQAVGQRGAVEFDGHIGESSRSRPEPSGYSGGSTTNWRSDRSG